MTVVATDTQQHCDKFRHGIGGARAQPPSLKSVRPKLFRRASLTSWGKDNLAMTRAAAVNLKELLLTVQQQKYEDRDKAAQREVSRNKSNEGEQSLRNRDDRRSRLLFRSTARRMFLENCERQDRAKWNANQARLCSYERRLLSYELAVKATAEARVRMALDRHFNDEADGIRWFEHNLDRLGIDPGGGSAGGHGGTNAGGDTLLPDKETTATFRSRLVRAVLDQKFVPSSNAETMAELRFQGMTGRRGRQERENRRIKTEVDQRRAKTQTDAERSAEKHLKGMLGEGRERREAAAMCWGERHNLEQKAVSDKRRFAEMAAAQENAFEIAFNARAGHARKRYDARKAERDANGDALRVRMQIHRDEKRSRAEAVCFEVAHKLSDLVVVASEARASRGGVPLPPTMWTHLKRGFCSAKPFTKVPPEHPPETVDPVLDAKTLLESKNLNHFEGSWRLRGDIPAEVSSAHSPLSRALCVARDLLESSGSKPREAPAYGRSGRVSDGIPTDPDVRLVLLGRRDGLSDLSAELARWVHLYVCSVETALECAMEVGAEVAATDVKGSKGRKESVPAGKKNIGAETLGKNTVDADTTMGAESAKDATIQKCFHPDATEEDVAAFKAAAVAYHALRTHPKKAPMPVSPTTMTDLLVKHLLCRAPRGRGWILVGYPSSLLEAKLLENALSGYTDEDVVTELGIGGKVSKPDAKTKSMAPHQGEEKTQVFPRSGLDAVLKLTKPCMTSTHSAGLPLDSLAGTDGGGGAVALNKASATSITTPEAGAIRLGQGEDVKKDDGFEEERDAQSAWWQGFEGGHLSCDVQNEVNNERLLETLFLLVNAAQNRKDEHEKWLEEAARAQKLSEEAVQTPESCSFEKNDSDAESRGASAMVIDRPSPLATPLTASLESLRHERRRNMSQSTRIHLEAMMGERELSLEGVLSAISQAGATASAFGCDDPEGVCSPQLTAALRKFEAECPALCVLEWAAAAEYSLSMELRTPDDRWTIACLQLEAQIADWQTRWRNSVEVAQKMSSRGGRKVMDGGDDQSVTFSILPWEGDSIWEALERFQLKAGDVVDDRHSSAESIVKEINDEADRKVRAWIGNVESAAAGVCAVERATYLETVEILRVFDRLFGLEEDQRDRRSADSVREATCAAANALAGELSATSFRKRFASDGGLEKEVGQAVEHVVQHSRRASSARIPHPKLATLPTNGCETLQETPLAHGCVGVERAYSSVGQSIDRAEASSQLTDMGTEPSLIVGESEGGKESGAMATAIWQCRQRYICRLRGVVMRLLRAVERCEAIISSLRVAIGRMKRRRVQLEHEGISAATATVRRALEARDHVIIADILDNGIPLWVEDDETFAADPFVALPWGMNSLGLPRIASLAHFLRRSLSGGEDGAEGTVSVLDLSHAVRDWLQSQAIESNGEGTKADIPPAWTSSSSGYVYTLCREIAGGMDMGEVSWRRLVHCLLLGHIQSLPTLNDLRSMRHAISLKASTPSQTFIGGALTSISAKEGMGPAANAAPCASPAAEPPTLRIAQRHLEGIPLWFEQQGSEAGYGGERAGSDVWLSLIRKVYSEAWEGGDGRVDGMSLLLTLCAAPNDSVGGDISVGVDEEGIADSGIPFSAGLFRAFYMLAESPLSVSDYEKHRDVAARPTSVSNPEEVATGSEGILSLAGRRGGSTPRVSLPHLRVILGHGGGMTTADVSDVCELVAKKEQASRSRSHMPTQGFQRDATAVAVRGPEEPPVAENELVAAGAEAGGVEATRVTEEDHDVASDETAADSTGGGDRIAALLKEPPFTVSFAVVSECDAVRDWVRRGAYTLPTFDVVSGRRNGFR